MKINYKYLLAGVAGTLLTARVQKRPVKYSANHSY